MGGSRSDDEDGSPSDDKRKSNRFRRNSIMKMTGNAQRPLKHAPNPAQKYLQGKKEESETGLKRRGSKQKKRGSKVHVATFDDPKNIKERRLSTASASRRSSQPNFLRRFSRRPRKKDNVHDYNYNAMAKEQLHLIQEDTEFIADENHYGQHLILMPNSELRKFWDITISMLVVYSLLVTPIQIAFQTKVNMDNMAWFDLMVDFFFLLDIGINFRTAYYDEWGNLFVGTHEIAQHYLKGWFAIDLIAAIPVDLIALIIQGTGAQADSDTLQSLTLLKFYRIVRINKVIRLLTAKFQRYANVGMIVKLFFMICLAVHFLGCLWYFVCAQQKGDETWITSNNISIDSNETTFYGIYTTTTYSTLLMLLGEDTAPVTSSERILSIIVHLAGMPMAAIVIGNVSYYISSMGANRSKCQALMAAVNERMRFLRLPLEMQDKVRLYYDYFFTQRGGVEANAFMNDLSPALRLKMKMFMHKDMVTKLPFFQDVENDKLEQQIVHEIVVRLQPQIYMPEEVIIRQGDYGDNMYFIEKGEVLVIEESSGSALQTLFPGDFFGEGALLENRQRNASVHSLGFCNLQVLSIEDFNAIVERFPILLNKINDAVFVRDTRIAVRTLQLWIQGKTKDSERSDEFRMRSVFHLWKLYTAERIGNRLNNANDEGDSEGAESEDEDGESDSMNEEGDSHQSDQSDVVTSINVPTARRLQPLSKSPTLLSSKKMHPLGSSHSFRSDSTSPTSRVEELKNEQMKRATMKKKKKRRKSGGRRTSSGSPDSRLLEIRRRSIELRRDSNLASNTFQADGSPSAVPRYLQNRGGRKESIFAPGAAMSRFNRSFRSSLDVSPVHEGKPANAFALAPVPFSPAQRSETNELQARQLKWMALKIKSLEAKMGSMESTILAALGEIKELSIKNSK